MAQNADKSFEAQHGKKPNQKLKPYLVQQYLLMYTDEDHVINGDTLADLLTRCGVDAERRSIYRDIKDINKVMWLIKNKIFDDDINEEDDGLTIEDAEEAIAEDVGDEEKAIVYRKNAKEGKGFFARHPDIRDIRLLAECVYSAKFLSQSQSDRLAEMVFASASKYQAAKIRHDAILTDRVKTSNKWVSDNIGTINEAMSRRLDGKSHSPEKISFQYLKYSIESGSKQVERRHGEVYTVSPYKLLISEGNYYLLAFSDRYQDMRTYRVDRMKKVQRTGEPRDGKEAFEAIDLRDYTKRLFSMFGGKKERVTIRFTNNLLDAVVDHFGPRDNGIWYEKYDDSHFTLTAQVEISDQFFGWVLGFGKKAKILEPSAVVDQFAAYLDKVREMY